MNQSPRVTVAVVSFNHAPYIVQALDSILAQDCPWPLEILLADDASTDGTQDILLSYVNRRPDLFIPFFAPQNQGITANYQRVFARAQGEFLAVLEGDDFWTSRLKLRRQIGLLQENTAFSMAASAFVGRRQDGGQTVLPTCQSGLHAFDDVTCLTTADLIETNVIGNFSTCVYRTELMRALPPEILTVTAYDWLVNIAVSEFGPVAWFQEPLSVYRMLPDSTWNRMQPTDKAREIVRCIEDYDRVLDQRHHDHFQRALVHWQAQARKGPFAPLAARLKKTMPSPFYRILCLLWDRLNQTISSLRPGGRA